jgi:hypothetical protein
MKTAKLARRWLVVLVSLALLSAALAILNNNFSFRGPTREDFLRNLDQAIVDAKDWIFAAGDQPLSLMTWDAVETLRNAALVHMLVDSARLSGDQRLHKLTRTYFTLNAYPNCFGRLVDPTTPFQRPPDAELPKMFDYQRWFLYAVAPEQFQLSPQEQANMFSPERFHLGHATHQLMALYFYRDRNGTKADLDSMMRRAATRIASEEWFDFRVTDLYLQRIAILFAAGYPDLVRRRWVERALAAQKKDGGWAVTWYGWAPTPPYHFDFSDEKLNSSGHATVQALWIACLLKYRYPDWMDRKYR